MSESRVSRADRLFIENIKSVQKNISSMTYEEVVALKTDLRMILDLLDESSILVEQKRKITNKILSWFNVKYPDWKQKNKKNESIVPRQILQCILYDKTDLTLKQIGEVTGGYKHENIIYSTNVVNTRIENGDEEYCSIYKEAIAEINKMK